MIFEAVMSYVLSLARLVKQKLFACFLSKLCVRYNEQALVFKHDLFKHLNDAIEQSKAQQGAGAFKLLEIGGGSGANFQFIEHPVEWTVVEPNVQFAPYFNDNRNKHAKRVHHDVKDLVTAYGEDLSVFPSNTFDAVVITLVLCSVSNVDQTLSEVKRVLKPGGSFYFMEHVAAPEGTWIRTFQNGLSSSGIWPFVGDGCYLNRTTADNLSRAGFGKVEIEKYHHNTYIKIISCHIKGRATKAL